MNILRHMADAALEDEELQLEVEADAARAGLEAEVEVEVDVPPPGNLSSAPNAGRQATSSLPAGSFTLSCAASRLLVLLVPLLALLLLHRPVPLRSTRRFVHSWCTTEASEGSALSYSPALTNGSQMSPNQ